MVDPRMGQAMGCVCRPLTAYELELNYPPDLPSEHASR